MTDEAINFNIGGTDNLIHSAKRIGDAFEKTQNSFNKYKSSVATGIKGGGSVASIAQSGVGQLAFFYALGKLTNKLLKNYWDDQDTKVGRFHARMNIKSLRWVKQLTTRIPQNLKNGLRFAQSIEKSMKIKTLSKSGRKLIGQRASELKNNPIKFVSESLQRLHSYGSTYFSSFNRGLGVLTRGLLGPLAGLGATILGATLIATGVVAASSVLLDRRVQAMFSKAVDFVQNSIIKPVTDFGLKFFEAYKFGVQKITGGLLQTASLDVNKKSIDKLSLPSEINNYLKQIKFDDVLAGLDIKGIEERQNRIEKLITENQTKHNQQIDDIIEAQKFRGRN